MHVYLQRARRALDAGRAEEAATHAWNALATVTEDTDRAELFRLAGELDDVLLQREVEERGFGAAREEPTAELRPGKGRRRYAFIAVVAVAIGALAFAELPIDLSPAEFSDSDKRKIRSRPESPPRVLTVHDGVWLVVIERVEHIDLQRLADELTRRYGIPVRVQSETLAATPSTLDASGDALVANPLLELLARAYRVEGPATVVGVTDYQVWSPPNEQVYTRRYGTSYAIVSTAALAGSLLDRLRGHDRHSRVRKLIARDIALLHLRLPYIDDPRSLRRPTIDDTDDIDDLREEL